MKKIKTLLILGAILLIGFASQSQSITYRFNNYMVVPGVANDTLIFDVEAKSNVGTTYTTAFGMFINFSATAFGSGALPVSVERLVLTLPNGYNWNTPASSAGTGRFASLFSAFILLPPFTFTYDITYLSQLTTAFQGVARYKMLITGTGLLGVEFYLGAGGMPGQSLYVLTSGGTSSTAYSPVVADNTLINLPPDPTNYDLMFSEFGDPSTAPPANFVEIYNAGAVAVDFSLYPWYLSANNSSSVQLTGIINAGDSYVIANSAGDFGTAYPGKSYDLASSIVGTVGTSQFELSTFGDYTSGTSIDVYDGSVTGLDYSGKHAVRHYDIVSPNLTLTEGEWELSAAENIDMTPGSHRVTLTWDGVPTSEWRSQTNWAEGFIPDAGHNVSIPNVGAAPEIDNADFDNVYCHDLDIASGAGLTILSDEINGDGSIITYGSVTGTATVQRFLGADRFWYVSQPVTAATANVFLHTWLFTYNETGSAWYPFIEDETTPLNLMKGYAVWTSSINSWHIGWTPMGDTTTSYNGTLNTGPISTPLTKGGDGWNFVGNPYPSAVDWDAVGWTKTNLVTNSFSVWNGGPTYGTYTIGGGVVNYGSRYIPAAQGFFVEASAAGILGVTNAVRTHSTQAFWKADEIMLNRLSMTVSDGEMNDETVIYFNENATSGLDYEYDATKLMAPAAPQAYTMLADEQMAINTFNNTTQTASVILGVNAPEAGEYTITASNIESFDAGIPIYLEDLPTGQYINLRETSSYSFSSGVGMSARFVVHFTDTQGIDDPVSEINSIYAVNLTVYVDFNAMKGEIVIYNILGQEISRSNASNGLNMVSVPQGNAVYIVKVISDNTTVTKKVFVK
ncbi:MAG: T9SS type A sorting domain-containing protein [Bacteroidales bacterium]|nr:T9SS type A sorting domain-containing protein [Bacteroidales bacterium]